MNPSKLKLPIGIQVFSQIVSEGYYYVDKTHLAQKLIASGKFYFLSRPRRFGKSLLLDTLKELFEGNQRLFKGLHVHDGWDWSRTTPVLRLSFGGCDLDGEQGLADMLHQQLEEHERRFACPARYPGNRARFRDLLARVHEQSGTPVAVLVDEYDKPILDNIHDRATADAIRKRLRDFYSVIKDSAQHVGFAFLTGVTKFSKVSLFSGLNNLNDITLDPAYSALCGYTDAEVDSVFAPELPGLERQEIRRWYNGYNWRGEAVYNPFDLLMLFNRREFGVWWFQTGTPKFLVKLLIQRHAWLPSLGALEADAELMDCFDEDNISPAAVMFQSGYLTIKGEERVDGDLFFQLGFPNHEVVRSFHNSLLGGLTADPEAVLKNRNTLRRMLSTRDFAGLERLFHAFFASIPHQWYNSNEIAQYEGYYASVFYGYFAALGLDLRVEETTNRGRIDMALRHAGHVWLFEFKVRERTPPGAALRQIKEMGYADKYRGEGVPIHMVGVEFSTEARNVVGFEVESA